MKKTFINKKGNKIDIEWVWQQETNRYRIRTFVNDKIWGVYYTQYNEFVDYEFDSKIIESENL